MTSRADLAVDTQRSGPGGTPVRLDLTLRPASGLSPEDFWAGVNEVQRSVPGCVRVVVLRGLSGLPDGAAGHDWSSRPSFVSVAVLDASADGPALDLAMAADLRVVTPGAALSHPGPGSAAALVAAVGYARALELAATGRSLSGTEGFALGLAQRLVAPDQLDAEVEQLVHELLTPERDFVRELKALLLGASERGARAQREAQLEAAERLQSLRLRGAAQG